MHVVAVLTKQSFSATSATNISFPTSLTYFLVVDAGLAGKLGEYTRAIPTVLKHEVSSSQCSPFIIQLTLFITHYSSFIVHYPPFIIHHSRVINVIRLL